MKNLLKIFIVSLFILSSVVLVAQPPDPDADPNTNHGGDDLGGNAPIASGITILLTLGAAYGGRKTYQLLKQEDMDK